MGLIDGAIEDEGVIEDGGAIEVDGVVDGEGVLENVVEGEVEEECDTEAEHDLDGRGEGGVSHIRMAARTPVGLAGCTPKEFPTFIVRL